MNLFLWGALPYIAFTFLIVGTLVRFFYFERNWTTKSSEFLEKKQLRIANHCSTLVCYALSAVT